MKAKSAATLLFFIAISVSVINAQPKLWGTMPFGGETESGTIFEINLQDNQLQTIHDFQKYNCKMPRTSILLADNDKFYGTAEGGFGNFGSVIYEYDPLNGNFRIVHDFFNTTNYLTSSAVQCALMQGSDGLLYGTTRNGGNGGDGVLFSLDIETGNLVTLVEFEEVSKGKYPLGCLIEASDGRLYGVTNEGGANGMGVLFVYDPDINMFAVLKHFGSGGSGENPVAGVIEAENGVLYGMTTNGGSNNEGVIYTYDIYTNSFNVLAIFHGSSIGAKPLGRLVMAPDGMLYGLASEGGTNNLGSIVRYDIEQAVLTKLLDFDNSNGSYPNGSLIEDNGYLWGMTSGGGLSDKGVLFKYDYSDMQFLKVLDFYDEYGEYPQGSLTKGPEGNLYGQTYWGGIYPYFGIMFEIDPQNNNFTKKFDFGYADEGSGPFSSPILASDGMIYGTCYLDGEGKVGTIYRMDPASREFEAIYHFNSQNTGAGPLGGITQASNGMMYGMASGGMNMDGILYLFNPVSHGVTVLHHFDEQLTGYTAQTNGTLLEASDGKLYGATAIGGVNSQGVLFEYDPNTSSLSKLLDFNASTSGEYPVGTPVQAPDGFIYGMTKEGGQFDKGCVYKFDPVNNTVDIVAHFDGTNIGSFPEGSFLVDDDLLYGICSSGGVNGGGTLFIYDTDNGTLTKALDLKEETTGILSRSALMKASNGLMYASTQFGASNGFGGIIEYDPLANEVSCIYSFTSFADRHNYGSLLEVESDFGLRDETHEQSLSLYPNPAQDMIIVKPTSDHNALSEICIYNMLGQEVHHRSCKLEPNGEIQLDISGLEKGIYFFEMTVDGNSFLRKFVKKD